ncbi:NfeD family protein [Chitinispirillales bacterium ANBcel5]|uniref:NfeD family protein n=1 Tax=Cellulosispirillum alkaliphilum TaxID=3039283 RepID=UPI002A52FC8C|nr:NfeD family protein [Chitinispirillales bacterium ANBcel5]
MRTFTTIAKLIFIFAFLSLIAAQERPDTSNLSDKVIVIRIEGTVDAGMAAFISRAIREAKEYSNPLIVFEIDTFGGQVDAAFTIADTIAAINSTPTVSYVQVQAISAGALIALAADQLYMRNNTTIGDVAPLIMSSEGPQMLGEKYQSPIRAKFRALARRNNYPEVLTEAMVTEELTVLEVTLPDSSFYVDSTGYADLSPQIREQIVSTQTVVRKGELLTMTDTEAVELGFSRKSVNTVDEMLEDMGYHEAEIIRIEESWSETLVRFIGRIAPMLMMIGFAALYIEIRSPGFGLPGLIGVICLAAVFLGQYMVGLADYTELLLLILGLVFLSFEVFVTPGFGFMGFIGILLMMAGMVLSFQNFVIPSPEIPWQQDILVRNITMVVASLLGSVVIIVAFFRYLFPHIGMVVKGPYLSETLKDARIDNEELALPAVGETATVVSALRPSGKVEINGEPYDVVTEGEFVDNGSEVVVSELRGSRIVVKRKV